MSDYRHFFVPGGVSFFTLVNYRRRPLLARPCDLHRLREVVAFAQARATLPLLDGGGSSRPRALRGDGRRCPPPHGLQPSADSDGGRSPPYGLYHEKTAEKAFKSSEGSLEVRTELGFLCSLLF